MDLTKTGLMDNPFFVKIIAMTKFTGEGLLGLQPRKFQINRFNKKIFYSNYFLLDFSGYFCHFFGTFHCADYTLNCEGKGVIDCLGACPGGEL